MKINRDNAEAWFLDYYEGNLSKEREAELFAFLAVDEEMNELFHSFSDIPFDVDKDASNSLSADWKKKLKKDIPEEKGISESNYNVWLVSLLLGVPKLLIVVWQVLCPAAQV